MVVTYDIVEGYLRPVSEPDVHRKDKANMAYINL